jgi:hypothetical protein
MYLISAYKGQWMTMKNDGGAKGGSGAWPCETVRARQTG